MTNSFLLKSYQNKERLRGIYKMKDMRKAKYTFDVLFSSLSKEEIGFLENIHDTFQNGALQYLIIFNHRYSNIKPTF